MIIKIIPENDEEKNRFQECFSASEISHSGVKEYFVFGNKADVNGQLIDFHEWTGSPRYLMGNLRYFFEVVNDERRDKDSESHSAKKINFPNNFNRSIPKNQEELENVLGKIEHPKIVMENRTPRIVKRGEVTNIQPIDISNVNYPSLKGEASD
jgi:hypothetical protein